MDRPRADYGVDMGTVLFVENDKDAPAGLAEEWAAAAGLSATVVRPRGGEPFPDPHGLDAVVVLGSADSVYDDAVPWIAPELAFVRDTLAASVPVLGICFGGQLLAKALGGTVAPSPDGGEVGWLRVETARPSLVPAGPWLQFHFDVFTVPAGATELARSATGPQAFLAGRSLGLQFHPEVDEAIAEDWARDAEDKLARRGMDGGALRTPPAGWAAARDEAMRLFDAWWAVARGA